MEMQDLTQIRNLKHMIDYGAENFGSTDFMCYKTGNGVESRTYNELKHGCDEFSNMLEKRGMAGSHVAVVGPTSFEWIVTFFGTADCGGVIVPLSTSETDDMNCKLIDFADVEVLVFDKKRESLYELVKKNLPKVKLFISIDNDSDFSDVENISALLEEYKGEYTKEPDSEKMCAIVFTSGTTGFPKGVMLSHKNYVYSATSVHVACPTKRMFCCLPVHHCFCFTAIITKSIVRGKTVCVNDSLANVISDLQLFKPDSIVAVPQLVKKIMSGAIRFAKSKPEMTEAEAVKRFLGGNIIDVISGGAALEADLNTRFNATGVSVFNGYGMTECAPSISYNSVGCFRHGSAGKPIPCMQVKIDNGEILVKGPSVMMGYYNNPEATNEVFTSDGWLHTGDIGHFDDEGYLYVTGRCKNLILLDNGENVSAEMLEDKFGSEPIVKEVICYGENGSICAEIFPDKAYMADKNITDIDEAMVELLLRVNSRLAAFQRISSYVIRDIPFERTSSSKIKRNGNHTVKKADAVLPKTLAERKVCAAVKELLMLSEVSTTDNFFAIGGNSLNAMELAVTLNINVQLIYDKPFLGVLAAAIDDTKSSEKNNNIDINKIIEDTKSDEIAEEYKCAFLTGATGFLGIHILKELVERKIKVYCLVRNTEKLNKLIEYYFGTLDMTAVVAVPGNIEKENLGLSEEHYNKIAEETDVVFHVAANVHHAGDYTDLERTNVVGTKNIIAFAKKANAVLQHTSTVSVHGAATVMETRTQSVFDENILDIGQHYKDNVYIHSKFCAEEEVLFARQNGLKANIYRIGNLTWRATDGKFQVNSSDNGFLNRVHAMLKLKLYNSNMDKYPTDLTAVDECAKAYVNLAFTNHVNEIYHMYNPNFLETQDMFKLLGVPYRTVSTCETVETVMANTGDRDIHVYMFYLIISGRSANIEMKNEFTVNRLAETGFEWSKIDNRYLTVSSDGSNGHCLDFEPYSLKPMRSTGGSLTPIQKLTVGILSGSDLKDSNVVSGEGCISQLAKILKDKKVSRPLIITFNGAEKNKSVSEFIKSAGENTPVFSDIQSEPTVNDTDNALEVYKKEKCNGVVAIGGGSVLDTAKIVALRAANPDMCIDDMCKLDCDAERCVPFFAVPTTAGTGSETTIFAVITDDEKEKKPFVSDKFLPDTIVLDPLLTVSVPKKSTAFMGIDALAHGVEAYISLFGDTFPEDKALAPDACDIIFKNLRTAYNEPENVQAREHMQKASYEAGLAFRRISTSYVHAVAHRLGEFYHIPHGKTIAVMFTKMLRAYQPYSEKGLAELAVKCGFGDKDDSDKTNAMKFIDEIDKLIADLEIDINDVKVNKADVSEIVRRAQEEAKVTGYPRPFSDKELSDIVMQMCK